MIDILPPEAVQEFKQIFKEVLDEDLNPSQAKQKAESFIQLFDLVTTNKNKYEDNQELYSHSK